MASDWLAAVLPANQMPGLKISAQAPAEGLKQDGNKNLPHFDGKTAVKNLRQ